MGYPSHARQQSFLNSDEIADALCKSGELESRDSPFECLRQKGIKEYWYVVSKMVKTTANKDKATVSLDSALTKNEFDEVSKAMRDAIGSGAPGRRPRQRVQPKQESPEITATREALAQRKTLATKLQTMFQTIRNDAASAAVLSFVNTCRTASMM